MGNVISTILELCAVFVSPSFIVLCKSVGQLFDCVDSTCMRRGGPASLVLSGSCCAGACRHASQYVQWRMWQIRELTQVTLNQSHCQATFQQPHLPCPTLPLRNPSPLHPVACMDLSSLAKQPPGASGAIRQGSATHN